HVKTSKFYDAVAQLDVSTASCHVRRDCYRSTQAGLRHDSCLAFIISRVQYLMRNFAKQSAQALGFFNAGGSHEDRLSGSMDLPNFLHHGMFFFSFGSKDEIGMVNADHRPVGWNDFDVESIDIAKFVSLRCGGSGHSTNDWIK